ncbi:MAG: hypothetical protein JSS81_19840 [Acidobacteria bacterium]|nr:hypothetical protein [Acidobacteriota bacterium]
MKNICSSHLRKAPMRAFIERFLRENSDFLGSETEKSFPKTIENQSNSAKRAPFLARRVKNCLQSARTTPGQNHQSSEEICQKK